MAHKRVKTRFIGVYVRTTTNLKRKHSGRLDRAYDFCYRDQNGKQCWVTAGWLSEGINAQIAAEMRAERIASSKKLRANSKPDTMENYPITPCVPNAQKASYVSLFSEAATNYLDWLQGESQYADRERIRYEAHLKDRLGKLPLGVIAVADADALKHALLPKMAIGTVNKCLNLCRAIYYHAIKSGMYSGRNPFSCMNGLKMPRGATACERFLSPNEAKVLLKELAKRSPQLRDMCYVLLHTGIRPGELFSLRGGDLVPKAGFFWVDAKGRKRERVAANSEILELLVSYKRKPREFIFQAKNGGKITQTSDTLRRTVEDLGLCPRTVRKEGRKEVRIEMSPEEKKRHQREKI